MNITSSNAARLRLGALAFAVCLAGCATAPSGQEGARTPNPQDPFEGWNRGVYRFNEGLDNAVIKPVATGYKKVVPQFARTGVTNFFGNFGDAWAAVNEFLQGKPGEGVQMTMRVLTNTTLGLAGLLDVATPAGLERRNEDFGQTLGVWGLPPGPYLVWPLLGPSSVRETFALPLDRAATPALVFHGESDVWGVVVLGVVNTRANLLDASRMLDELALDKYSFVRDAYIQRRRSLVYDGNPPDQPDTDANSPPPPGEPASGVKR